MGFKVAVVGATGNVGRELLTTLAEREFPADDVVALASSRSIGREVSFGEDDTLRVEGLDTYNFRGVDIVLSSPGAKVSAEFAPRAAKAGAVVIDNTSHFRMEPDVPLVVPEVNPEAARDHKGIIANPNCCAIPLAVVLDAVAEMSPLRRVVVDTYQAASGAGWRLVEELDSQRKAMANDEEPAASVYPHVLEGNVVPGGWVMDKSMPAKSPPVFEDPDAAFAYNQEELKIIAETRKILGRPELAIACTTVRVPVQTGHSEAVWIETEVPLRPTDVRDHLAAAPGVTVRDDPEGQEYPLARDAAGTDEVDVGRIRRDLSHPNGLALWIASDNLRKGAATNTIQIAELLFD
jgi:aspartate-semialdehyde dehydrogenase